jgi:hypothetical protein
VDGPNRLHVEKNAYSTPPGLLDPY